MTVTFFCLSRFLGWAKFGSVSYTRFAPRGMRHLESGLREAEKRKQGTGTRQSNAVADGSTLGPLWKIRVGSSRQLQIKVGDRTVWTRWLSSTSIAWFDFTSLTLLACIIIMIYTTTSQLMCCLLLSLRSRLTLGLIGRSASRHAVCILISPKGHTIRRGDQTLKERLRRTYKR